MKKLILALAMGALAVTASAQDKELKVANEYKDKLHTKVLTLRV